MRRGASSPKGRVVAMFLPSFAGCGQRSRNSTATGANVLVELEDAAVAGVGVDDELGAGDAAVHVLGQHGGHHPVVVAVGDQGRLGDRRQVGGSRAAPLLDRLELRLERLHRDRGVPVDGALLEPVDERAGGGLAGGVAVEEQELLRVRPGQRRAEDVPVRDPGDLVDVLAAGRAGPGEDQLADQVGVLDHECLGDHAAEGEGEDVDLVEAERADEGVGVVGHRLDAVGNLAGGGADAAVVERDDVVLLGDRVDDARVPVVQVRREVDEEDHGDPALRPELTIGVGHAAGGDGAGRCLRVGRDDGVVCWWCS